jgi:hypothetical protein
MEVEMEEEETSFSSPALALASLLGIVILLGGGYLLKDQLKDFLAFFISAVEEWGPWGYLAYAGVYIGLEVLAVPAIPLTMTAGVCVRAPIFLPWALGAHPQLLSLSHFWFVCHLLCVLCTLAWCPEHCNRLLCALHSSHTVLLFNPLF